jgi:hypothetical protein
MWYITHEFYTCCTWYMKSTIEIIFLNVSNIRMLVTRGYATPTTPKKSREDPKKNEKKTPPFSPPPSPSPPVPPPPDPSPLVPPPCWDFFFCYGIPNCRQFRHNVKTQNVLWHTNEHTDTTVAFIYKITKWTLHVILG